MTYGSTRLANNILARSFAEERFLTPMKLQRLLYFVASEYQKATKRLLFEEPFSTWAYGPVLYSVHDQFRCFGNDNIKRFARDAQEGIFIIDETQDIELKIALDRVWYWMRGLDGIHLSKIATQRDSAWDKAFQAGSSVLKFEDITEDTTYRKYLEFDVEPAEWQPDALTLLERGISAR